MAIMFLEKKFVIHTTHTDFKDIIRPYAILDFFQDLAGIHAEQIGVGFEDIAKLGYIWVVLYEQYEVLQNLCKYGDEIIVRTWPKPRGRLEFEREYEICDSNGNLIIKGISNWALIDINKRTIAKANDVNFNGEFYQRTNYTDKQKRKLNLKPENIIKEYNHQVVLSDLDHNMHMNNSKYLDILYNMQNINDYKICKKVEIAFIHEAKLNDIINVKYYKDENNRDCYIGFIDDKTCFEAILTTEE